MTSVIQMADERGEFVTLEDGYVHYWPHKDHPGGLSSAVLRLIANELDDRNAVWNELCKRTVPEVSQAWVEGLRLIDKVIVGLLAQDWQLVSGDDGARMSIASRRAAIEMVASVAESQLFFRRGNHRGFLLVIPNNGCEAICDHTSGEFGEVVDRAMELA